MAGMCNYDMSVVLAIINMTWMLENGKKGPAVADCHADAGPSHQAALKAAKRQLQEAERRSNALARASLEQERAREHAEALAKLRAFKASRVQVSSACEMHAFKRQLGAACMRPCMLAELQQMSCH